MDSSEILVDTDSTDSSNTVILWTNKTPMVKCTPLPFLENLHKKQDYSYKIPTGISGHFYNSVIKASENFVNGVILESKWAVLCYLKMNK